MPSRGRPKKQKQAIKEANPIKQEVSEQVKVSPGLSTFLPEPEIDVRFLIRTLTLLDELLQEKHILAWFDRKKESQSDKDFQILTAIEKQVRGFLEDKVSSILSGGKAKKMDPPDSSPFPPEYVPVLIELAETILRRKAADRPPLGGSPYTQNKVQATGDLEPPPSEFDLPDNEEKKVDESDDPDEVPPLDELDPDAPLEERIKFQKKREKKVLPPKKTNKQILSEINSHEME